MAVSRLVITFGASETWDITGEDGAMRDYYDEIKHCLESVDGTGNRFVEVIGFSNRAGRSSESLLVKLEDIRGVSLQENA